MRTGDYAGRVRQLHCATSLMTDAIDQLLDGDDISANEELWNRNQPSPRCRRLLTNRDLRFFACL